MVGKVKLIDNDTFYSVLVFEDPQHPDPTYRECFSYNSKNQQEQLTKARKYGEERARALNTNLEDFVGRMIEYKGVLDWWDVSIG